ncbi:hypothetical protein E2C01_028640 [Portunus trituberculatus]|uniref:Uncharacterized protein n=1 Tax=Portunus trituberculatus TaxID=210409 RepID=A0A5B7EM22_PORTR|nr:hypothetical protein [Portunus trituberculatus]
MSSRRLAHHARASRPQLGSVRRVRAAVSSASDPTLLGTTHLNNNAVSEEVFLHLHSCRRVAASTSSFLETVGHDGREHRRRGCHSCRP